MRAKLGKQVSLVQYKCCTVDVQPPDETGLLTLYTPPIHGVDVAAMCRAMIFLETGSLFGGWMLFLMAPMTQCG